MNKYYDMNTAAEEAGKNAMPTPCEMFNKMQGLQRDYDVLLMHYTRKCKERDGVMRTLHQTTVKLNDETARADALQRRCDDLEKSLQAWVRKCEALTGQLQEVTEERERLREKVDDFDRARAAQARIITDAEAAHLYLYDHPWKNLWRHIKEALGLA